jgi:hypothetical protein
MKDVERTVSELGTETQEQLAEEIETGGHRPAALGSGP